MRDSYELMDRKDLNKLLNIRLIFSWVILAVICTGIISLIIWSAVTPLPSYVEGSGVLMNRSLVKAVISSADGMVNTVREGGKVHSGAVLATIKPENNTVPVNITATDDITVLQQWIYPYLYVREGQLLFTVEKENFYRDPVVIAFVAIDEAEMVKPGMEVLISFSKSGGLIKGKITGVSPYPASPEVMFDKLANNDIIEYIKSQYNETSLVDVTITIPTNKDGTREWLEETPDRHLKTGTLCHCSIIIGSQTFLGKLFPWIGR